MIHQLTREFLASFAKVAARRNETITAETLQALSDYHWPGNVRELRNVIERAVALSGGESIGIDDLPDHFREVGDVKPAQTEQRSVTQASPRPAHVLPFECKAEVEMRRITEALTRHGNNRRRAAAELGISRMTLYNKLHKYHFDPRFAVREALPAVALP